MLCPDLLRVLGTLLGHRLSRLQQRGLGGVVGGRGTHGGWSGPRMQCLRAIGGCKVVPRHRPVVLGAVLVGGSPLEMVRGVLVGAQAFGASPPLEVVHVGALGVVGG